MKNNQKILLFFFAITILMAVIFLHQQKKINSLAQEVSNLNDKTNQSSLAAKVALQQSTEIVQAIENSQANLQPNTEWENRTPIGFKFNNEKG